MNGSLTTDEIERLEKVMCTAHSDIVFVAGMPVADLIAWSRGHQSCELTVVLRPDRRSPLDIARALMQHDQEEQR